jgi:hypothetical protein
LQLLLLKIRKEDLEDVYIRCKYNKGLFDDECQIKVGFNKEWVYVNKKEIVELDDKGYAIKGWKLKKSYNKGIVLTLIRDVGDYKLRIREVALDDIVSEKEIKLKKS